MLFKNISLEKLAVLKLETFLFSLKNIKLIIRRRPKFDMWFWNSIRREVDLITAVRLWKTHFSSITLQMYIHEKINRKKQLFPVLNPVTNNFVFQWHLKSVKNAFSKNICKSEKNEVKKQFFYPICNRISWQIYYNAQYEIFGERKIFRKQ